MKEVTEKTDLLYPSAGKREELNRRRLRLAEKYPCTFIDDLMTENLARVICRRNPGTVLKLFREMCNDREVIDYRLDALEDIMGCPELSPAFHRITRQLLESEHMSAGSGSPDSFAALSAAIESLEGYIRSVEELHGLHEKLSGRLRSQAFGSFFEDVERRFSSEEFGELRENITELKRAVSGKIRSVTVAINFSEDMKPVSVGVVGFSDKPAGEKPSVFDRLFYKNAAYPDVYVMGKLRTSEAVRQGDVYVREADKALFNALENITSSYMTRLQKALACYERLTFDSIHVLDEQLEIYDGLAAIIMSADSRGLRMCRPQFSDERRKGEIKGLFDPCFFLKAAAASPGAKGDELLVRNDISFDEQGRFYILTGPNNGGKTTFVRGVGLCFLMAQTGFYVPAESCVISGCDFLFTHFPREEETGLNASRFTTEIKAMKTISELATGDSLLLMNESIQSTTPTECAEIAGELVRVFCIIGVRGIFATHITEVAGKCDDIAADPDCRSRPMSLVARADSDGKRLYRISPGEPSGSGLAADIFRQFGISADEVRKRMRKKDME